MDPTLQIVHGTLSKPIIFDCDVQGLALGYTPDSGTLFSLVVYDDNNNKTAQYDVDSSIPGIINTETF